MDAPVTDQARLIEEKIKHVLTIYPKLSPSMIQIGLGTSLPASIWRPVLQSLIDRKILVLDTVVSLSAVGRSQSYTVISLNNNSQTQPVKGV